MSVNTHKLLRKAIRCESGLAATEFAMLLPIMVILFFGMLEASEAMTVNRRVATSVNALADLTSQLESVSPTEFDSLVTGVVEILEPSDTTSLELNVISVIGDADGNPIVHWSRAKDGSEPYPAGSNFTLLDNAAILKTGGSLIVAEMTYPHRPSVSHYVMNSPIQFYRTSVRWPRLSSRVQFCPTPSTCTT